MKYKRYINRLPLPHPKLRTWPATQACALTGNQTSELLVHRSALSPLSHISQDFFIILVTSHPSHFIDRILFVCSLIIFIVTLTYIPLPYHKPVIPFLLLCHFIGLRMLKRLLTNTDMFTPPGCGLGGWTVGQ